MSDPKRKTLELARAAAEAIRDEAPDENERAGDLWEAVFPRPPKPDPAAGFRAVIPKAAQAPDGEAAAALVRGAIALGRPPAEWWSEPEPPPVIWRKTPGEDPEQPPEYVVLRRGEVGVLASEGGLGKSFLTLQLAVAAANGGGETCGFQVAGGPVLVIGYEDTASEMTRRIRRILAAKKAPDRPPARLRIVPKPPPLFEVDPSAPGVARPSEAWDAALAQEDPPVLVIVDPAGLALRGSSTSESGPVRAFLEGLQHAAEEGGFAVLVVAHDTKAARRESRAGRDPGAGVVAGSAAWYDAPRAVLYMRADPTTPDEDADRILEVVKVNYGPKNWGIRLELVKVGNRLAGFRAAAALDSEGVWAAVRPPKSPKRGKAAAKGGPATVVEEDELPF